MTYSSDTTAVSELTGQPVSTWSKEWQHECEERAVLAMSKAERSTVLNGSSGEEWPMEGTWGDCCPGVDGGRGYEGAHGAAPGNAQPALNISSTLGSAAACTTKSP